MSKKIEAIVTSDWHLSLRPPLARSVEPNWLEAQARPLAEIRELADGANVPVFCTGDVFDRWNAPPELINWAMDHLPANLYAISGNHDQPGHVRADLGKSAYWTLVQAGKMINMRSKKEYGCSMIAAWGFPHGSTIMPCPKPRDLCVNLAVVHKYIWSKDANRHVMAGEDSHVAEVRPLLAGYDVAAFGDNHKGFLLPSKAEGSAAIINCGTLLRRTIKEIDYAPFVGLLYDDRTVVKHFLDVSKDRFAEPAEMIEMAERSDWAVNLLLDLAHLRDVKIDFMEALRRRVAEDTPDIDDAVRRVIHEVLESVLR